TAALDERIAVAVPFNFGGPQPETRYPLSEDVESTFAYAGSGSWESTRNLARSAVDGFLPWVIVGSIAPRQVIVGHEFSWDQAHDPVWMRMKQIYQWYDRPSALAFTHGKGELKQSAPQASHCTHIGPLHRVNIHAALNRWFDWNVSTADEFSQPRPKSELFVGDRPAQEKLRPQILSEQLLPLVDRKLAAARERRAALAPAARGAALKADLAQLFGWSKEDGSRTGVERDPPAPKTIDESLLADQVQVQRLMLRAPDQVPIPLLILRTRTEERNPAQEKNASRGAVTAHRPVVLAIAHGGKSHFLQDRTGDVEQLLRLGYDVVIPDLRGMGQHREDERRGRSSSAASRWATALMLGEPLLGQRLRDLQIVIDYVCSCPEFAQRRLLLWGDAAGAVNPGGPLPVLPHDASRQPSLADADGPTLVMLAAIFDERIQAVYTHGAILDWRSALQHPQALVSVELVVPGWLTVTDGDDLCAALAPRPLALIQPVNGLNQLLTSEQVRAALPLTFTADQGRHTPTVTAVSTATAATVTTTPSTPGPWGENSVANWFERILAPSTK
ncbi:MAG: alpha/beta hydrolase family protein, partial [Planctomycetota bacterium]